MAKDYNISKTAGACFACGKEFDDGQDFMATVAESEQEIQREDYCLECWQSLAEEKQTGLLGIWRSCAVAAEEKRKLFVGDELLTSFFERLNEADSEAKIAFRFVLALVLMRKKLLVYDHTASLEDGTEVWKMHFKGSNQSHSVIDPKMDEDKIREVSSQLGQILEGEL